MNPTGLQAHGGPVPVLVGHVNVLPQGPRRRVSPLAGGTEVHAARGPVEVPYVLADLPDNLAAEGAREPPAVQHNRVGSHEGDKIAWKKARGRKLLGQI